MEALQVMDHQAPLHVLVEAIIMATQTAQVAMMAIKMVASTNRKRLPQMLALRSLQAVDWFLLLEL
jgi:hypothetical protein